MAVEASPLRRRARSTRPIRVAVVVAAAAAVLQPPCHAMRPSCCPSAPPCSSACFPPSRKCWFASSSPACLNLAPPLASRLPISRPCVALHSLPSGGLKLKFTFLRISSSEGSLRSSEGSSSASDGLGGCRAGLGESRQVLRESSDASGSSHGSGDSAREEEATAAERQGTSRRVWLSGARRPPLAPCFEKPVLRPVSKSHFSAACRVSRAVRVPLRALALADSRSARAVLAKLKVGSPAAVKRLLRSVAPPLAHLASLTVGFVRVGARYRHSRGRGVGATGQGSVNGGWAQFGEGACGCQVPLTCAIFDLCAGFVGIATHQIRGDSSCPDGQAMSGALTWHAHLCA